MNDKSVNTFINILNINITEFYIIHILLNKMDCTFGLSVIYLNIKLFI